MRPGINICGVLLVASCFRQDRAWELFNDPEVQRTIHDQALWRVPPLAACFASPEVGDAEVDLTGTFTSTACQVHGSSSPESTCERTATIASRDGSTIHGTGAWFDGTDQVTVSGPAIVRAEYAREMTAANATLWLTATRDLGPCRADTVGVVYLQETAMGWTFCDITVIRDAGCTQDNWLIATGTLDRR